MNGGDNAEFRLGRGDICGNFGPVEKLEVDVVLFEIPPKAIQKRNPVV
jgi:hypothetical protein